MKTAGVGIQIVGEEGYGSEFAKYPAEAADGIRKKIGRFPLVCVKKMIFHSY